MKIGNIEEKHGNTPMTEMIDQAEIFKRWEKFITDEWNKRDAIGSYVKQDQEEMFRQWVIQKIVACFTMAEVNGRRLQKIERNLES
jgi:sulfatase maturation enzyme AslB (radical SAM superfamily)